MFEENYLFKALFSVVNCHFYNSCIMTVSERSKTTEGDHSVCIKKDLLENTLLSCLLGSENSSPARRASRLSRVPEDLRADPFLSGDFFPCLGQNRVLRPSLLGGV